MRGISLLKHNYTGDIKTGVQALLDRYGKPETFQHSKAVAEMNMKIARQYGLDEGICEICGYLHDISAVVSPSDMMLYAAENNWHIDEAERKYPFLLHQRISKVIAQDNFNITDQRVLSAVEHHTTLRANPSAYDMALFVADKLAWDQEGEPPYYATVSAALGQSLEAASLAYMDYIVDNNMILHPHRWFEEGRAFLQTHIRNGDSL